jgi:hypothetical protein
VDHIFGSDPSHGGENEVMSNTLQDTIRGIRRRAWIAKFLYGCGWILSATVGFLLLIAGVDFILRQDDRLSRITLSLIFLMAVATFISRLLLPLIKQPLTDVLLAQRIQQRFPTLRHKVATAIEFLKDEQNAAAGSRAMRQAVIREASEDLQKLPMHEVVHYRHVWRAISIAFLSISLLLVVAFILPVGSKIAVARIMNPFGDAVWPQVNDLVFQNTPSHIRLGGLFEAEIVDKKNKLPETVNIEYLFEKDGSVQSIVEPMKRVNGMMVAQRENIQTPFKFRAIGGDDQTEWHSLQTVIPPTLKSIQFEVHPPAYTGWPVQQQEQNIWGLVGSEVTLRGTASVPLTSATLTTASGSTIPLKTESKQYSLLEDTGKWALKKTGSASLSMVDQYGVEGKTNPIAVRVIPESAPTVQIEKPKNYYRASPDAILPLEVFAEDNLAIREIKLHFHSPGNLQEKSKSILLFENKQSDSTSSDLASIERQIAEGEQQLVKYDWDLSPYQWKAGTEIIFYATAQDGQPAEGRSAPEYTLQIVGKEQLAEEMALRQQGLLAELARVVNREKETNEQTSQLEIAWQETGSLTDKELQSLRGIELTEREIRRAVSDQQDGLQAKIRTLESDLKYNQIGDSMMSQQLQRLHKTLSSVEQHQLRPLQTALNTARKFAQNGENSATKANQKAKGALALTQAKVHQEQAIRSLQPLVNELLQFNQYRRMSGKLAAVAEQQANIRKATENLANTLSGRTLEKIKTRDQVALQQTAEQQESLNRNLESLLSRMEQAAENLHAEDPEAGDRLAATVKQGREQNLGKQMRSAHKHLEENQTGQAIARQKQASVILKKMLGTLQGIEQQNLDQWIEKLRQAEADLARLAAEQLGIQKEQALALSRLEKEGATENSKQDLQAIQEQRDVLEKEIQSLARRVKNLQAAEANKNLSAAANKTQQAGTAAQQGDANASAQRDKEAAQHIDKAREQLAGTRQQAESAQLDAQLSRLPEQLTGLLKSQKTLLQKTKLLDKRNGDNQKQTRVDKANIIDLSREQLALVVQIQPIKKGLALAEILQFVLMGTAAKMQSAAEKMGQFQTGKATQALQQDVIKQLEMVLHSLKRNSGQEEEQKQGGGGGSGGQGGGAQEQEGTKRSMAEIRLLKLLQIDLNRRIQSIQEKIKTATNDQSDVDALIEQLQQLGPEQAKLAIWTLGLLRDNDQDGKKNDGKKTDPERIEL